MKGTVELLCMFIGVRLATCIITSVSLLWPPPSPSSPSTWSELLLVCERCCAAESGLQILPGPAAPATAELYEKRGGGGGGGEGGGGRRGVLGRGNINHAGQHYSYSHASYTCIIRTCISLIHSLAALE